MHCRVAILVKALPQPSRRYGETVCCAGVTADRQWRRLYPIRFRHLSGASAFRRWDWVSFDYRPPTRDTRQESCHVHEETIRIDGQLSPKERLRLLQSMVVGSASDAMNRGASLAIIRPRNTRFIARPKSSGEIEAEREAYRRAAGQLSLLDQQLAELEPTPFHFRFIFEDAAGRHNYRNGDWESHAMFFLERSRSSEARALQWMSERFNDEYPRRGMAFAIGNQAKRPRVWQLLGVIRLDEPEQGEMQL